MGKVVCLMPLRTISEGWVSDSKIGVSLYFDLPAIMSQFPTPETIVIHDATLCARTKVLVMALVQSTPDRTRTCDLRIRNPLLYPAELRELEVC